MATSPRVYRNKDIKDTYSQNPFERPKDMVNHDSFVVEKEERLIEYITFYRRNVHIFAEDYFGVKLHPYQILMFRALQTSTLSYTVASRGCGKTFIVALFALCLGTLWPGSRIITSASTKQQAGLVLDKIKQFRENYPNVAREILNVTTNNNTFECNMVGGSVIKSVPSSPSARGNRATYLICDESAIVPQDVLDSVLKPMLYSRTPPYRLLDDYKDENLLKEEGRISYITSASYKVLDWWKTCKTVIKRTAQGDSDVMFLAFNYLLTLKHSIKTESMLKNEMENADEITRQHEYLNIASGQSGTSYFPLKLFRRTLKKAFYPFRVEDFGQKKKNSSDIKKTDGELRFLSVDIASRGNKTSDQSIISMIRCLPTKRGFSRQLVSMESFKGKNVILQALRIKQLFFDFDADYIVMDFQNLGAALYDSLGQVTRDDDRDCEYKSFTVVENNFVDLNLRDELRKRTLGANPLPIIFPILATASLNSQIAVAFRSSLQKKMWEFLALETEGEEYLAKINKDFVTEDSSDKAFYLNPFVQTTLMIGECVNLDMSINNGLVKLQEKTASALKDRYSSVSYGNWVISECFDPLITREEDEQDDWEILSSFVMSF